MQMMKRAPEMETCIQDCLDCYRVCMETKNYCLEQGGKHAEPEHIKTLSDCMELCKTSAHFMIKDSELHTGVCDLCAEACRKCAESCEKFEGDEQMENCAKSCRQCASSCETMAAAHA